MEQRFFNVSQDVMLRLLEKEKESFIANCGQGYGLQTDEILLLAFNLLSSEKERTSFLQKVPFDDKSSSTEIIKIINILDEFFSVGKVDALMTEKGYYSWLKIFNEQEKNSENKHLAHIADWDDIYYRSLQDYKNGKKIENSFHEILQAGRLDILEKHENWKVLSELGKQEGLDILWQHQRYQEMLSSGQEYCYALLYENERELLKRHLLSAGEITNQYHFNIVDFLLERKDWDILSESPFYRQYSLRKKLWFLLLYREKMGKSTERIWHFLSGDASYNHDVYRDGFMEYWSHKSYWDRYSQKQIPEVLDEYVSPYKCCHLEAFHIWLYKNVNHPVCKKELLKQYSWRSNIRKKMNDPDFPKTLTEIEKALKG